MARVLLKNGQSLIELVIAIGLFMLLLPILVSGLASFRTGNQQIQRLKALLILKETQEAVRNVRERGWTFFAINGTYYPQVITWDNGGVWQLIPGEAPLIEGFRRQIKIEDVYRKDGMIVPEGDPDPSTKKVTLTVSWDSPYPQAVESTLYLTRYLDNGVRKETSMAQFRDGKYKEEDIEITNDGGGSVKLRKRLRPELENLPSARLCNNQTINGRNYELSCSDVCNEDNIMPSNFACSSPSPKTVCCSKTPVREYPGMAVFLSRPIHVGLPSVAFNRFWIDVDVPEGTSLQFQTAIAELSDDETCESKSYVFVGPNGTENDYFTVTSQTTSDEKNRGYTLPLDDDGVGFENPGDCFKFKAFFSTNRGDQTPILYEAAVNFSP